MSVVQVRARVQRCRVGRVNKRAAAGAAGSARSLAGPMPQPQAQP